MASAHDERISRLIRQGRARKRLLQAIPCGFTLWLLRRKVEQIEVALGPPDRLSDTWGRLYRKGKPPLAVAHEAKLRREAKDEEHREARVALRELFASYLASSRAEGRSDRQQRPSRQRRRASPNAAEQ